MAGKVINNKYLDLKILYLLRRRKTVLVSLLFGLIVISIAFIFSTIAKASFGTWGDTSLVHACKDPRGRITIVAPTDTCNQNETQLTFLRDVDAGSGLSITRSSSGATLSLANTDGWTVVSENWTYASSTTFTVSGDATARYQKGTKVKLTQTTIKYFYVVTSSYSSGTTTVTMTGGNDYSLENAAITNPYYSYVENPQGFPDYFSYTPTATGETGSAGTFAANYVDGKFSIKGKLLTYYAQMKITDKGSWSLRVQISLPVPAGTTNSAVAQSGWIAPEGGNPVTASRGFPVYASAVGAVYFLNGAGTSDVTWSNVSVNDWVNISGTVPL